MKTVKHLTRRTFLTIVGGVATVGAAVGIGSSLLHRKEEAGHPAPLRDEPPITVQDDFSTTTKGYLPLYLQGSKGGSMTVAANTLHLQLSQEHTTYALAHPQVISGHFYAEIEFDTDQSVGLALIAQRDGKPDPQNFTSINIDTNLMSDVLAQVIDRQHGKDNVRDNTGLLESPETRYQTTLNGLGFSVPFSGTRKKIRILRDGPAGFFHFYYKVGKKVTESAAGGWPATQDAEDWLELAPSRDWNPAGTHFYIAPYVRTASAQTASIKFKQLFATNMPKVDQSDVQTGFKAVQRDYHWSGYAGNAYVVTFGKHFPYQDKGYKFVFWDRANYEPAWHFTNNLLYSYEHLETWQIWGFQGTACFEPMSDRLLRWSKVEIVEDNAVRKVLKWSYVLCNPNYLVPDEGTGRQLPIAIEYYTFYPDGTGTRRMRYYPKLDANENNWHELAELMVIKGTQENKNPVDYIADPVFTAANLEGKQIDYSMQWYLDPNHGDIFGRSDQKTIQDWKQMILVSHLKGTPDPYIVFSNAADTPEVNAFYPATTDISWHGVGYQFAHWPVGREPYIAKDGTKTSGTWPQQVAVTSLAGVEMWSDVPGGATTPSVHAWGDHYQLDMTIDPAGPRKFREWVALIGLVDQHDLQTIRAQTATWLYPGNVTTQDPDSRFVRIDYQQKAIVLTGKNGACHFTIDPGNRTITNPVFQVEGWGDRPASISMNGHVLRQDEEYVSAIEKGNLLLWVKASLAHATSFDLTVAS